MGSEMEPDRNNPIHTVNIAAFNMMETEVTWGMYQPCIDAGVCRNNDDEAAMKVGAKAAASH